MTESLPGRFHHLPTVRIEEQTEDCSETASAEKEWLCRLQVSINRETPSGAMTQRQFQSCGSEIWAEALPQNYFKTSYFFSLFPDTVCHLRLCPCLLGLYFACFTLHLLPGLILVLLSLIFKSLLFMFLFLLPLPEGLSMGYLIHQGLLTRAVTRARTEGSLGWWTTAGADGHICVTFYTCLSYNSHNNTEGTRALCKNPPLSTDKVAPEASLIRNYQTLGHPVVLPYVKPVTNTGEQNKYLHIFSYKVIYICVTAKY